MSNASFDYIVPFHSRSPNVKQVHTSFDNCPPPLPTPSFFFLFLFQGHQMSNGLMLTICMPVLTTFPQKGRFQDRRMSDGLMPVFDYFYPFLKVAKNVQRKWPLSLRLKCECGVFQMWKQQKTVVSWCVETRCAMPVSAPCANITTFLCLCPLPPDWPSLPHPPVRLLPLTGTCTDVPAPFFSVLCDWPMTGHR